MIGIINLPIFLITTIIIIVAPGPDFLYVTARGISQGKKAGVHSALGISTGLLIHTLLAALGLSAIIQASRAAYLVIKYLGAAYLVFLGLKTLINKDRIISIDEMNKDKKGTFHQGVLTNVFNPKAIITFMAFLPQFVDFRKNHPFIQYLLLGSIISFIGIIWFGVIGYFAGLMGSFIKENQSFQRGIKFLSGSVLILLGLRLAYKNE